MDSIFRSPPAFPDSCHPRKHALPPSFIHGCRFLRKNLKRGRLHPTASFNFESESQRLTLYGRSLFHFIQNEAASVAKFSPLQLGNTSEEMINKVSPFPLDASLAAVTGSIASYFVTSILFDKKLKTQTNGASFSSGEYLLVTSGTPFNRFVLMRCQCIEFEESDVYELLSTENRHLLKLRENDADYVKSADQWARVLLRSASRGFGKMADSVNSTLPDYQRTYIYTRDGGVLAIDWPSCLDLAGENELDTAFLLIAGTAEGSRDKKIHSFVQKSLGNGYFPIVMNPRGCGGSPLITPRMFTAGDSSDVQAAVHFVLRSRPWSTIMAVGWDYGANMLAKYLGEEAEVTPVTAAVCVNNPFDLEESTKASSDQFSVEFDQNMTKGFIQILKENQMIFEGRKNKFDVKKGLSAKSVREFDRIISRVSSGFVDMQNFYGNSSSKSWINSVRIPTLYIQDNTGIGKPCSIPHHMFEENPYTTLLLSLSKTQKSNWASDDKELSRIDPNSLIIEWLSAVELAFLKGRHPLVEETDVIFKPPKEWGSYKQQSLSSKNQGSLVTNMNRKYISSKGTPVPMHQSMSDQDNENSELGQKGVPDNASKVKNHAEIDVGKDDDEVGGSNVERGQLEWAAETVLDVLDIAMPGTLSEKMKEEVLEAVGKGETIVSAVQAACPEDAREKIMMSLSAALQAKGISLKLAGFGESILAPRISESILKEIQENFSSVHNKLSGSFTNRVTQSHLSEECEDAVIGTKNEAEVNFHSAELSGTVQSLDNTASENSNFQNVTSLNVQEVSIQDSIKEHEGLSEIPQQNSSAIHMNERDTGDGLSQDGNEKKQNEYVKQDDLTQGKVNLQEDERRLKDAEKSASLSVGMSQALGILTNVDDSTQMAVTNVFEVIENVIDELEREQQQEEPDKQTQDEKEQSQNFLNNEEPESNKQIYSKDATVVNSEDQVSSYKIIARDAICVDDKNGDLIDLETCVKTLIMPATSNSKNTICDSGSINRIISNYYRDVVSNSKMDGKSRATGVLPADVAMEYFEDENVWKFINQNLDSSSINEIQNRKGREEIMLDGKQGNQNYGEMNPDACRKTKTRISDVIEPTYVLIDNEGQVPQIRRSDGNVVLDNDNSNDDEHPKLCSESSVEINTYKQQRRGISSSLENKVKDIVIKSIHLELLRRFGESHVKIFGTTLSEDVTNIGLTVAQVMRYDIEHSQASMNFKETFEEMKDVQEAPKMHFETIMHAINDAYGRCVILPRLMPIGLLSGLVLAQLNALDVVNTGYTYNKDQTYEENLSSNGDFHYLGSSAEEHVDNTGNHNAKEKYTQLQHSNILDTHSTNETLDQKVETNRDILEDGNATLKIADRNPKVMDAMAVAVGATTAFAAQKRSNENFQDARNDNSKGTGQETEISNEVENPKTESDDSTSSIVSVLAEKAMTIAAPVVPVTEDGAVDHDKLVVVLAGLSQKGGLWRYVGKIALFWSGLRGAMSLTDRLLVFLNISDRPLHQRLFGFVVMALLLWSPVLVPLLPTLLQQWASQSYNCVTSNAALVGLYGAIVILIAIWGRKIRGYDDPLGQYGVKLQPSSGIQQLLSLGSGYILGFCTVIAVQVLTIFYGYAVFSWDPSLCLNGSKSFLWNVISSLRMFKLILECLGVCLAISFVEELIFRSWLQDEISADLGFHKATLLSGLAFAVSHWYFPAIPGLWLLSLVLTGIKVKCNGNLVSGIGIHAGLIAGKRFINEAGKLTYAMNVPIWLFGTRAGDPLTGFLGIFMLCVFALFLYPWDHISSSEKTLSEVK